jgi:hypothetical protein
MLRESISEAFRGHPDETVAIRSELGRLVMSFITIENLSNGFALVWSQRRDVHQRLYAFVISRSYNSTRISVTD